jgi:hypothetical protein
MAHQSGRFAQLPLFSSLAVATVCTLFLTGCPVGADLEDPERFAPDVSAGCDAPSVVFQTRCAGGACHGAGNFGQVVDLVSPDVAARLYNIAPTATTYAGSQCIAGGKKFIDPAGPTAGLLAEKLEDVPTCGNSMKSVAVATDADLECIRVWTQSVIANPPTAATP